MHDDANRDRLLNAPLVRLFPKLALPIALGLLVHGLYSFVDAIFVARFIGTDAFGGVSAAFPLYMVVIALNAAIGSGMASLIARQLGAANRTAAHRTLNTTLVFAVAFGASLSVLLTVLQAQLFELMALPINLRAPASEYITPIIAFATISFLSGVLSDALRAMGEMRRVMGLMLFSAVLNIVLDALFIIVFDLGVPGVAWATVVTILVTGVYAGWLFWGGSYPAYPERAAMRWHWPSLRAVLLLGAPVVMSHTGYAVGIAAINFATAHAAGPEAADLWVSANGVIQRVFMLLFLPVMGMMIALQTVAGYNHGAGQAARVREATRVALGYSLLYTVPVAGLMVFSPHSVFWIFSDDPALMVTSEIIAEVVYLSFPLIGALLMLPALMQATGRPLVAVALYTAHTWLILMPTLAIGTVGFALPGVRWALPITDAISAVVMATTVWWVLRQPRAAPAAYPTRVARARGSAGR
ncbi:MAG: MATE family efflux transporter [Pseudomonadota bacterium]